MRRSVAAAIALVAALIATSLLVPGLAAAAPGQRPASTAPAVSTLTVMTTNQFGGSQAVFETGLSNGQVNWAVVDTVTTDKTATVTITDKNASRDGLPTPAFTTTANLTGGANYSYVYGFHYLLPVNLTYGGAWEISATAGSVTATANFTVWTYNVESGLSASYALPAESIMDSFLVDRDANDAPYSAVTGITITGTYTTKTATIAVLPGTPTHPATAETGAWSFTVPTDASGTLTVEVWANVTSNGVTLNQTTNSSLIVGGLAAPSVALSSCPQSCGGSPFAAGTQIYVNTYAGISGTRYPAAGLSETFKFLRGTGFVTMPSNVPTTLTTNAQGVASLSFFATVSSSMFSLKSLNTVSVTLADPQDPSLTDQTTNVTFSLYQPTAGPVMSAAFDQSQYFEGATATVNWALGGNSSLLSGWSGSYWVFADANTHAIFGVTTLSGTATSGSITVTFPANYLGLAEVIVVATNATDATESITEASVIAGTLALSPSEVDYQPGDQIEVGVSTNGAGLSGTTLWGSVTAAGISGTQWIFNGQVSGNKLTIDVPNNAAPGSYRVTVSAQSSTGGTVANASITLYEAAGYDLRLGISSSSNYVDGSYQAGQTVTVNYNLLAIGGVGIPATYTVYLTPSDTPNTGLGTSVVVLNGGSGSFSYTIPSGTPNGQLMVSASTTIPGGSCGNPGCAVTGQFSAQVNNNPAALSYQFGGSGFTLGALILVLVAIVLIALGVFWFMRRRRPTMVMKPETSSSSASAPSSTSTPSEPMTGAGTGGSGSPPPSGSS
jgi:hypothetical protein